MNAARRVMLTALAAFCTLDGGLLGSSPALAVSTRPLLYSFGPEGFNAAGLLGRFARPEGVAGAQGTGDVYVYDAEASGGSVYKFDAAGEPVDFSASGTNAIVGVGEAGGGEGEIAVDGSGGPDGGDIYVASGQATYQVRVYSSAGVKVGALSEAAGVAWKEEERPCGVAVDAAGEVYVGLESGRVEKFTPMTGTVSKVDYASSLYGVGRACNVAVDFDGDVYVAGRGGGPVFKYAAPQFNTTETPASGVEVDEAGSSLAVDPFTNDLFIHESEDFVEYGPSGGLIGRFGLDALGREGFGIAVGHASGDVYADNAEEGLVKIFGPAGPNVGTEAASTPAQTSATLHGTVDPEGVLVSGCRFEYGTSTFYGQNAPCVPRNPGSGTAAVAVSADLNGLQSGVTYHFRLLASNA